MRRVSTIRNTEVRPGPHDDRPKGVTMDQPRPDAAAPGARRLALGTGLPRAFLASALAFACGLAIVLLAFWPSWRLLAQAWADSET